MGIILDLDLSVVLLWIQGGIPAYTLVEARIEAENRTNRRDRE